MRFRRKEPKLSDEEKSELREREILRVAKEEGGQVTPALIALKTSISLEKSEAALQDLVKRGYASMHVTEDGRVVFEFPEFRPRLDDNTTTHEL